MSTIIEQIDKAIGAHGAWTVKLRQNIDGTLALVPAEVGVDNRCEFGKWLHSLAGTPILAIKRFWNYTRLSTRLPQPW